MQIPTSLFYDRAKGQLSSLSGKASDIQQQIATGKKLVAPSDDAASYLRLRSLKLDGANAEAYGANLKLATSVLAQADTTLTAMSQQVQRATELMTRARNGTLTATDRAAIGEELASVQATLESLVNAKDVRGQFIFGGADGAPAASATGGVYTYATTTGSAIPTGDASSVQTGEAASRFMKLGDTDLLTLLGTLATSLKAGTATDDEMGGAIDQLATAGDQISTTQSVLGARAARVDLESGILKDTAATREEVRSGIEDTDVTQAVVELQKTMTILQASQASFTKLAALSLFDYLR